MHIYVYTHVFLYISADPCDYLGSFVDMDFGAGAWGGGCRWLGTGDSERVTPTLTKAKKP